MSTFDSLEKKLGGNSSSSTDDVQIRYIGSPTLSARPQTILDYEEVLDVAFTGNITEEQNIRGNDDWQDNGASVLVVKNPELKEGDLYTDGEGRYQLVNLEDDDCEVDITKNSDGEMVERGVEWGSSGSFEGESVERFTETAVESLDDETYDAAHTHHGVEQDDVVLRVFFNHGQAQRIGQVFDRLGGESARYFTHDGETEQTFGLVEYPHNYGDSDYNPSGTDNYPRFARTPDLRTDIEGAGRLIWMFGPERKGNKSYEVHAVDIDEVAGDVNFDDIDERELQPLTLDDKPDDAIGNLDHPEMPTHACKLVWNTPEDAQSDDTSTTDDAGATKDESIEEAKSSINVSALADGDEDVTDYDDLTDNQQAFVDEFENEGLPASELDDFDSVVEDTVESGEMADIDPDVLADIINERV